MIIFAEWRSHNGQLIFNESVTHEAERGIAISNWQPQPPKVVTSLSCGPNTSHPSPCKSRCTAEPDVMKRRIRKRGFLYLFLCFKNSQMFAWLRSTCVLVYVTLTCIGPLHCFAGNHFESRRELRALAEHEVEGYQTAAQAL